MRILVTGDRGFIGSQLSQRLCSLGHAVKGLDLKEGFDLCYKEQVDSVVKECLPEAIYHLASYTDVGESMLRPGRYVHNNVDGTLNLINAVKEIKLSPKFIFASSASVYGEAESIPATEEAPTSPISIYGLTKVLCERITRFNMAEYIILRISNVYGDGGKSFLNELLTKKHSLRVHEGGKVSRDYVHVEDVVNALVKSLELDSSEVINISSGKETFLFQLLHYLPRDFNYVSIPLPFYTPRRSCLDNSRAKAKLGWVPQHDVEKWFKTTARRHE
mgnify:CR=1 FL=1